MVSWEGGSCNGCWDGFVGLNYGWLVVGCSGRSHFFGSAYIFGISGVTGWNFVFYYIRGVLFFYVFLKLYLLF